ncbi:PAS domain-containing hybrid sensor histidine kinase/response regulator [Verrucomicrobium spinosum]|nr:PAS domain S-box protein [Verrucomicrobium spinosum]
MSASPVSDSLPAPSPADPVKIDLQFEDNKLGLLEAAVAHLSDMVLVTEADPIEEPGPRIVFANDAFLRRTGYTASEVLGRSPRFLQGPSTSREALDQLRAGLVARQLVRVELLNYTKSGDEFWLEIEVVPVLNASGSCTHFVAIERDITGRKLSEQRQDESEAQMRRTADLLTAVVESTPDALFVKDVQGRYLLFNEGAARVVGKRSEEVVGHDDSALFGPSDVEVIRRHDRQVMATGETTTSEEMLTSAGVTRTFLATKSPYRDSGGEIVGIVGISRDITERKLAEEKLREQATLLDKAKDAILVRDLHHKLLYWNRGAERIYGWQADEVLGASVKELLYDDPAAFEAATAETLVKGEWAGELSQRQKSGKILDMNCHWTLVRDDAGQPKSILAINTDSTDRKKLEKQFLRAQRMESIGTLAGGIAHDLNNVLTPIVMSITLLRAGETSEEKLAVLDMVEKSANRGAQLIKQVLTFARGVESRTVVVQLRLLLYEVEKICSETFLKSIQIRVKSAPDLWPVLGDPTQLHQVLLNLCVNARDAMHHGGTLTLQADNVVLDEHYAATSVEAKPGPYVVLQVSDTGAGMSPEVIDRIFEPFFTTKETGKGTGLGLSTTLAIVKSHGGFLKVHSERDVGTRFQVYLPAQTDARMALSENITTDLPRGNGELVLVVDDEASVREITQQTLEAFGYKVLLACDGAEATATYALHRHEIDVVLADMMMPLMDGPTMIQVLVRINPKVKVLAASGLNADGMVARASNAGARDFLPKPYTAGALLRALRQIIDGTPSG